MLFQSAEKSDTICFLVSWSSGGYFRREGKPFRTRLPYSGLLLLVLAAPFERLEAVFTVSRQQVTNLELVILISLLAWSGSCTLSQRPRVVRTRLALPIFCLLAWMFLSSLFASAHRANSLQFTARCLVGVLIFSMVVQTVTHRRRLVALMVAATLVACVVAALGVLESFEVAWVLDFLQAYRPGIGFVKNQVRASSTFQYPTIASMYLELAFGLSIGLLLCQARRWQRSVLLLSSTLIAAGTIVTLTRTGLILLLILPLLAAGFWLVRKGADDRFHLLLGIFGMVVVLLGLSLQRNPLFWLRLTGRDSSQGYQVEYDAPTQLARIDHRFGNEGDFGRPERFSESFAIDPVQVE